MKKLISTLLLQLVLAIPVYADDLQDGVNAFYEENYNVAIEKLEPLAKETDPVIGGNDYAQELLGKLYLEVFPDFEKAAKYLKNSSEHGNTRSMEYLGDMYRDGKEFLQDFVQAHKWYNLSGRKQQVVKYSMARDKREALEQKMTAEQIFEAQKLAKEWFKQRAKEEEALKKFGKCLNEERVGTNEFKEVLKACEKLNEEYSNLILERK
jgi:TPR repeat protein